jgi:hypothetical protein
MVHHHKVATPIEEDKVAIIKAGVMGKIRTEGERGPRSKQVVILPH